jgi:intraflagellar transport protein 88
MISIQSKISVSLEFRPKKLKLSLLCSIDMAMNAPGTAFRGPNTAFRPIGTSAGRQQIGTSMGRNPPPMSRGGLGSRAGLTTGMTGGGSGEARPMTSVSGAGYKGSVSKDNRGFDPLNMGNMSKGPAPPLAEKADNSPEDKAKEMEKKVHRLLEATADAIVAKDMLRALEKAKEAGKAERAVCKFRESNGLGDHINLDLTYVVCFNLANVYYHNKMYDDALNTFQLIVKNKQYPQSGRLRVNMGNIYYEQKKYPQAIKMYRMALDQIPSTGKELRYKILRNIGNAFVRLGQFQDALENYESIMNGSADIQSAFNALLCLYARGDKEKMKKHFINMLRIPVPGLTEEDAEKLHESISHQDIINEHEDALRTELQRRMDISNEKVLTGARLIAPVVEEKGDWEGGYRWVIDQLRSDFDQVLSKFEIDLSMMFMRKRRFEDAIGVLKNFEKKDMSLRAIAGTNLSFIYFLEGDYAQAEKHADVAIKSDRYNAKALVNKGNCMYVSGEFARAREMYLEAVGVEADCIEAIYNLGLVNLKLQNFQEAQSAFDKLVTSLPSMTEALFQLAAIYERSSSADDWENAAKTYQLLLNKVPGDPGICCRLGQLYEKLQDDNTACHWHTEAHRAYPVNLNVISWLGVWYVKREMYEQAIEYFQQAAQVQPSEIKWQLMVTSCYRRLGDLYKALELYQKIHEDHPENIEALQYLEALCRDLGRSHEEYSKKLEKLRRSQPAPSQNNAAATRANNNAPAPAAAPQRSERPRPERSERPSQNVSRALDDLNNDQAGSKNTIAAPRAGGGGGGSGANRGGRGAKDEDDDFGDTDVTSLLV